MKQEGIQLHSKPSHSLVRRPQGFPSDQPSLGWGGMPDLKAYWQIIRNRRKVIALLFLVIVAGVGIGTKLQSPVYRAGGVLEIGKESPDIESVETLFKLESVSDVYLETQFGILKSATLAGRVIRGLHLDSVPEFNPPPSGWSLKFWKEPEPDSPVVIYEGVLSRFQSHLLITPTKGSRLVQVSFDSENPQLAAAVVNSILANYLQIRIETSQKTTRWLSQQLETSKVKLEKSENELQQYARLHGLLYLGNETGTSETMASDRLQQTQTELLKAQALLYEKQSVYDLVQKGDYASLPAAAENKVIQDLTVRLADLKRDYAQLSATFTPEYPKVKQTKDQIDDIEGSLERERKLTADRATNEYVAAKQRVELIQRAFRAERGEANGVAERSSRYNFLKREVDTNRQLYGLLQQKLKEVGVSANLKANNANVVDMAIPPKSPDRPQLGLNLALACILGLGLGVGVAFLQEYLDTSLKSTEEVGRFLDVPALAMIPSVDADDLKGRRPSLISDINRLLPTRLGGATVGLGPTWHRIDEQGSQFSALTEAFGALRTSVLLNGNGHSTQSLLVTSSQPGEGKTTVSVNLAISLARLGHRVLLIDADIRRPSVHKALKLENRAGLVNFLRDEGEWAHSVQRCDASGLEVLTAGTAPANPAELLSSWRMQNLVTQALVGYDFVILDSPALLISAPDARILARLVDGAMVVVRSGSTPRNLVQQACLEVPNVIGVILNKLDTQNLPNYYNRYYAPEGPEAQGPSEKKGMS
jgi:succinoglycan biosynthesis transport protein ExoP